MTNNLISVSVSLALVSLLLLGYYLRTRRVQGKLAALWEAQLKAMDRQNTALERIVAALEGGQRRP
jgi:cell division protein FtsB